MAGLGDGRGAIGLSYAEDGGFEPVMEGSAPGMFHNVYMQPWSYRHFRETGEFPEGTMFILAMYEASQNADPARGGWYEDEGFLAEIHLKQEALHESGWGFYGFGGGAESASTNRARRTATRATPKRPRSTTSSVISIRR